jgi:hypothetical protein
MPLAARGRALAEFQSDPPTTVFLLSIRAGACGINLTQANEVFLLEPCLNPALEAQAVGRVHRMGQTRDVRVTRLVMAGSVEERILEAQKAIVGPALPRDPPSVASATSAPATSAPATSAPATSAPAGAEGVTSKAFAFATYSSATGGGVNATPAAASAAAATTSSSSSSSSAVEDEVFGLKSKRPVTVKHQAGAVTDDRVSFKQTELAILFS